MKIFRVSAHYDKILQYELIKETANFIIFKNENGGESREKKYSKYGKWFKTEYDAYKYLETKYINQIQYYNKEISMAKERLSECHNKLDKLHNAIRN